MSPTARKHRLTVAVFGSSEPGPGDPLYESARRVGTLLAQAGCRVLNGGYGGIMEACSRGAREAGGTAIGVTVESFSGRTPNAYLHEQWREPDLHSRNRRLIEAGDAFIILPGRSGTLSELTLLWALLRAGQIPDKPVALMGDVWTALIEALRRLDFLEPRLLALTHRTTRPEEAVAWVLSRPASNRLR